ncbi:uncharacterized protein LOC112045419 [Bicyclus anynana]|uniref:Uncharacterized protein LOC112045419 n=1 Tax=Bicyclus anynana TaxID=110368 RepID=A0ABM3LUB0_BICAN|nr:uncharacterized protein LOC112045419 [Bicyclus anynana]
MELMSSLLLCALVAFLPQALGEILRHTRRTSFVNGYNDSLTIRRKISSIGKNVILNKASQHNTFKDLQSVLMDPDCRGCYVCMERAMNANKPQMHMMDPISTEDFQNDRNLIDVSRRDKRAAIDTTTGKKYKRSKKDKKEKRNKGVTVIKYNENGKMLLKVKETDTVLDFENKSAKVTTCEIYSVEKSFSCESPEANLILTDSRKKKNKKDKMGYGKRETTILEPVKPVMAPFYRKTNEDAYYVDQILIPSIEDMY